MRVLQSAKCEIIQARTWTLLARNVLCCSCKYVENKMKTEADDEDGGHID